jgi:hypothetical protein
MADTKAKLTLNGDTAIELDVLKGTLGQDVIDIRTLGSKGVSPLTLVYLYRILRIQNHLHRR